MSSNKPSSRQGTRGFARKTGIAAGLVTLLSVGAACLFLTPSAFADGDSSTTTSTPTDATVALGASNTDSATVTGSDMGTPPTGTVQFYACGPTASPEVCTPSGSPFDTETLDGTDNPSTVTSVGLTPDAAGTWCFAAVYSGDSNYAGSSDGTTDECFTVSTGTSTITSAPGSTKINLGTTNTDTATVASTPSSPDPTGTVAFYACGPTGSATPCTPSGSPFDTEPLNGTSEPATVTSASFTPSAAGEWCFAAVYSGDSNFTGSNDGTTDECFSVKQVATTTVSAPSSANVATGRATYDTATVTGDSALGSPTGSVTFYLCGPTPSAQSCVFQGDDLGTTSLTAGASDTATAASPVITPTTAGVYCFGAYYSGDASYINSSDTSVDECFNVGGAPTVKSFSPTSGKVGKKVTITGTNLTGATAVKIGGVAATIVSVTATKIVVKVATGDKTGKVVVVTPFGSATSKAKFKVT
jgi:hypothetical protein